MMRNRRDHHLTGCPQMVRYRQRKGRMVMFADDGEPGRPNAWPARPAVEEKCVHNVLDTGRFGDRQFCDGWFFGVKRNPDIWIPILFPMRMSLYRSHDKILVAVDCIIFGFDGRQLKALLVKRGFEPEKGKWSLMGGFVGKNENAEQAASRVLYKLTGLRNIYMEQLFAFSDVERDHAGRVISIAYFALINIKDYSQQLQLEHEARWLQLNRIPRLVFDHRKMVMKAKQRLQEKVVAHPVGFELLPPKFTLPQLQNLYEAIYGIPLDKRNFTKKILSLGVLNKLDEKEKESSRRGAFYYVFDGLKYKKLQANGVKFI